jgi:hypothetical protein
MGGSSDRGRDAIHISRQNPDDITIFAYAVRGDWENKLLKDCNRIREEKHEFNRHVFACTSSITAIQRNTVTQKVLNGIGWTLETFVVASVELSKRMIYE